jgi:hypothetical protein
MERQLLEHLHGYFSKIEAPTDEEKSILKQLTEALPFFTITHVSRDDLRSKGFDVTGVSDADMESLARKMGSDYCEQLYWNSLEIIASEYIEIPLMRHCPVCESKSFTFDGYLGKYVCSSCGRQWSDNHVLVEFPEESTYFEDEDIGYPCFTSEDNGARYVPEYEYLLHFKKYPTPESLFRPVVWPDSQNYLHNPEGRCEIITADEKALEDFGGSAVWVPVDLLDGKTDER